MSFKLFVGRGRGDRLAEGKHKRKVKIRGKYQSAIADTRSSTSSKDSCCTRRTLRTASPTRSSHRCWRRSSSTQEEEEVYIGAGQGRHRVFEEVRLARAQADALQSRTSSSPNGEDKVYSKRSWISSSPNGEDKVYSKRSRTRSSPPGEDKFCSKKSWTRSSPSGEVKFVYKRSRISSTSRGPGVAKFDIKRTRRGQVLHREVVAWLRLRPRHTPHQAFTPAG